MCESPKSGPGRCSAPLRLLSWLAILLIVAPAPAPAAAPPAGKTYFTLLLGMDEPYAWEADCIRFTAAEICSSDGSCGTWSHVGPAGGTAAISFQMAFEDDGVQVRIDGLARIDDRGRESSFGGAARLETSGQSFNFGITGRAVKRRKCARLLRGWDIATTPPQPPQDGNCLDRAEFGKPGRSRYVLPFLVGESSYLSQTYCYLYSTHRNEYAYDFDMPVGATIVAARGGVVVAIRDDLPDTSPPPEANYLKIRHDDGTVASYIHLQQGSVSVAEGQRVERGEVIARASRSGTLEPHLHFVVFLDDPPVEGRDAAVSFSNADGPLDALGGLIQDQTYTALPE